jgi:putative ABC transport system substrate-binding protein
MPQAASLTMRRRDFLSLIGSASLAPPLAVLAPRAARAQQTGQPRVAVVNSVAQDDADAAPRMAAFRQGLRQLGWTEGQHLRIDYFWSGSDPERIAEILAGIKRLGPDVIVSATTPVTVALRREIKTTPVVFLQVSDPIAAGLVASLASPGGNFTGFTNFEYSISGKWLEIIRDAAPATKRVGLMFNPDTAAGGGDYYLAFFEQIAPSLGFKPMALPVRGADQIEAAAGLLGDGSDGALVVMPDSFTTTHRDVIIAAAARHRVPAIYPFRFFVTSGGLVSYGIDNIDLYGRAAAYVDRILKGARVADLPVQQPAKFELAINLKTAAVLGVNIPSTLLARADQVVE